MPHQRAVTSGDSDPQVSVIVAAYNGADYIARAVDSVLSQSVAECETIVIDDGSTDATPVVLEPYIAARSIQYHYQPNGGLASARNAGILQSRGKYLCFLDQDDWLESDSVACRLALYERYPELGFVFSDFRLALMGTSAREFAYAQSTLKRYRCLERLPFRCISVRTDEFSVFNSSIWPELLLDGFAWVGTVMFRRDALVRCGAFCEGLRWAPDHDLCIQISRLYDIGYVDKPTAVYRQHASNMSLSTNGLYTDAVTVRRKYLDPQYGLLHRDRQRVKASIADYYLRQAHSVVGTENHWEAMRPILQATRHNPLWWRCYRYLLLAMAPKPVFQLLKRWVAKFRPDPIVS